MINPADIQTVLDNNSIGHLTMIVQNSGFTTVFLGTFQLPLYEGQDIDVKVKGFIEHIEWANAAILKLERLNVGS